MSTNTLVSRALDAIGTGVSHMLQAQEKLQEQLAAGLSQFHAGVRLQGARAVAARPGLVWGGTGRVVGWSLTLTGTPGVITLTSRTGETLAVVALADGASDTTWLGPGGVSFGDAVELSAPAGATVAGVVYIGAVD